MDLDPAGDKADHILAILAATTDPIYQLSPKSTWWGMEKNPRRRPLRRSSRRLKNKSLAEPICPGNWIRQEIEEESTMAYRMTRVC
jgi:hypothetical protein